MAGEISDLIVWGEAHLSEDTRARNERAYYVVLEGTISQKELSGTAGYTPAKLELRVQIGKANYDALMETVVSENARFSGLKVRGKIEILPQDTPER